MDNDEHPENKRGDLLFAVVDTAAGGDYADGKIGKALILDGSSDTVKIPHYAAFEVPPV